MITKIITLILVLDFSFSIPQILLIKNELLKYAQDQLIYSLAKAAISKQMNIDCLEFLEVAFNYEEDLYLIKLLSDSGKTLNDLGSYLDCITIDYRSYSKSTKEIKDNLTYLIVHIFPLSNDNEEQIEYIIGICAPNKSNVCSALDYKSLVFELITMLNSNREIGFNDINVYNIQNAKKDIGESLILCIKFLPLVSILVIIVLGSVDFLPKLLCYPCYRNKSKETKQKVLSCFSSSMNSYEILSNNKTGIDLITNDNGLSIVKGLRGLAMIFFIIGYTFKHLYYSPVKIYVPELLQAFINNFRFVLILFGLRYAKGILFALSSFTLIYKTINYLDDDDEKNSNDDVNDISEFNESDDDDNDCVFKLEGSINSKVENKEDTFDFFDRYPQKRLKLRWISLFNFIFRQAYKYIIFVLTLLIFKYCLYELFSFLSWPTPVWFYLKEAIIDSFDPLKHLVSNALLYSPFSNETFSSIDLFMMAYNEIFFFIVFSVVIYIGYKWNKRLDLFCIALFLFCSIGKALLLIFLPSNKGEYFYPSKVYQKAYYSFILSNPLYNMPSALIGLFFGLMYFSVQNSIKATNIRRFLIIPNAIATKLDSNKILKIVLLVVSLILFLLCVSIFLCVYSFVFNADILFFENIFVNMAALYDVDIGLIALFMFIICLFLLGNNFLMTFLTHDYWNFISRPYFLFLIDINVISYYIFYQSESMVKLELFNVLFYSLLIFVVMLVVNSFLFIFFEIPLKKLNKLVIRACELRKGNKRRR